ncbi:hypothetical protein EUA50_12090 [Staphylococcus saprophyticus]|uniref:hypothetical protein n=1 Tax=Staphylococcus saprophyticus TaxID=29385 RepID=UPI0008531239|nr:hypothetical protein [Staphylococcus saprophyticus]MDW4342529.1 hypothetical protein [Staphylococcus saprophyticus]MDW4386962.1 hypothetical protein [Staphylococcus saprophyticus]MDW4419058.1 hypothetical protein [Staphylococcus saprophyticus]MDW4473523.1 hypothetical protein [Staphylococcus saprophyticus]OEK45523.1 hypothetical protein ASS92_06075 [Staphylococcus saprophyticus]
MTNTEYIKLQIKAMIDEVTETELDMKINGLINLVCDRLESHESYRKMLIRDGKIYESEIVRESIQDVYNIHAILKSIRTDIIAMVSDVEYLYGQTKNALSQADQSEDNT